MLTDVDRAEPACTAEPTVTAAPSVTAEQVRAVARRLARGVVVVSAAGGGPAATGAAHSAEVMTADTLSIVSLYPPLLLVAMRPHGRTCQAINRSGGFAVSVLAADQAPLARLFAEPGRDREAALTARLGWRPAPGTGAGLLPGALGWLDCRLRQVVPVDGHVLVIGDVTHASTGTPAAALVRFGGSYRRLVPR